MAKPYKTVVLYGFFVPGTGFELDSLHLPKVLCNYQQTLLQSTSAYWKNIFSTRKRNYLILRLVSI